MIGLDTNVVIRFIVQDDLKQSEQANNLIQHIKNSGENLWISLVTLCEIIWVLEKCYQLTKKELIFVLEQLLETKQIEIERDDIVWQSYHDFQQKSGVGFSDCLIGRLNLSQQCSCTYTFDKAAAKQLPSSFKLVP